MITVVGHESASGRRPAPEPAITQDEIQKKTRDRGNKIEGEDAADAGKIREGNQGELSGDGERDVKPGAGDPCFGSVQRPKRACHCRDDRAADHQQQLAVEVRVFVAENKEELFRKKYRGSDDGETESGDRADDRPISPEKARRLLATRERGCENVREEIAQDGKDHRKSTERAYFRNRADLPPKNADQENRDLALKTEEDCIRRLAPNETDHRGAVLLVLGRVEINDAGNVTSQHPVLE